MLDSLIQFFTTYGYFAVFGVLLLCGFGLPIPEDITLVAGGFISSLACPYNVPFIEALDKCHHVHVMFFVCMAGVLIGDSTMFLIGYFFGFRVLKVKFFLKLITPKRLEWAQEKFEKQGTFFVFLARFMPGLRSPIFVITGMTRRVSYLKFLLTDGAAALISVPIWVYLGFWGERQLSDMSALEHYVKRGQMSLLAIIAISVLTTFFIWYIRKKIKQKSKFFE